MNVPRIYCPTSPALRLALLGVLMTSSVFAAETAADVDTPTWATDVAPIVYKSCVTCHRPGQVAPMSLLTYDQARPWGKAIARVTHDRTMPPWFANPEHGHFVEDVRLTDQQIDVISRWATSGMAAGDMAKA